MISFPCMLPIWTHEIFTKYIHPASGNAIWSTKRTSQLFVSCFINNYVTLTLGCKAKLCTAKTYFHWHISFVCVRLEVNPNVNNLNINNTYYTTSSPEENVKMDSGRPRVWKRIKKCDVQVVMIDILLKLISHVKLCITQLSCGDQNHNFSGNVNTLISFVLWTYSIHSMRTESLQSDYLRLYFILSLTVVKIFRYFTLFEGFLCFCHEYVEGASQRLIWSSQNPAIYYLN